MKSYFYYYLKLLNTNFRKVGGVVILLLIVAIMDAVSIGLMAPFVSFLLNTTQSSSLDLYFIQISYKEYDRNLILIYVTIFFILLFVVKSLLTYYSQKKILYFAFNLQRVKVNQLMSLFHSIEYSKYLDIKTHDLINNTLNLTNTFTHNVVLSSLRAVADVFILIAIVSMLFIVDMRATLILFTILVVSYILYIKIVGPKLIKSGEAMVSSQSELLNNIQSMHKGFIDLRMYKYGRVALSQFYSSTEKFKESNAKYRVIQVIPRLFLEVILILFMIIYGAYMALINTSEANEFLSVLAVFSIAAIKIIPSLNSITTSFNDLKFSKKTLVQLYDYQEFISQSAAIYESHNMDNKSLFFDKISINIDKFRYSKGAPIILQNINVSIKKNQSVAIVGESGTGKTTLLKILVGLLGSKENVKVDSMSIFNSLKEWQNSIAYIPQDVFLLNSSIKDNIVLDEVFDQDRFNKCVFNSQLNTLIDEKSNGENFEIIEHGANISGGQRQRIAIARALYSNRSVIAMDEATSSLDANTENKIADILESLHGQHTFIIIAHRNRTIEKCDFSIDLGHNNQIDPLQNENI
jgi:ATP-binding cassette, subfamily B, bacterial PglK